MNPLSHLIAEYYFHPDSIIRWMGRNQQEATGQMTRILQPLQSSECLLTPFAGCDAKAAHSVEQKALLSCCLLVVDSHPGNESWRRGLVVGGQVSVEIFIVRSGVEAQREKTHPVTYNDSVDLLWTSATRLFFSDCSMYAVRIQEHADMQDRSFHICLEATDRGGFREHDFALSSISQQLELAPNETLMLTVTPMDNWRDNRDVCIATFGE